DSELSSEIINFYLYDPANQFTNQLSSNVQALVDALTDLDINLPENLGNIESIMIDGMPVNLAQLEQTMIYLKTNPDAVVNIKFSND
ncbi:MAG: hypothetical protein K9H06_21230, partial [Melioribacteraceae bacterium]|nr:hypothetical protein [Melioribacteraceae bacterium]